MLPRAGKLSAALAVIALVGAFGASLGVAGNPSRSCSVRPATSQPFLNWKDSHFYFLAPGGDMESNLSTTGWWLSGGAGLVSGSESYDVTGDATDSMSLGLPDGSLAMSSQICVTIHDPELRFFVLNTGNKKAQLEVDAVIVDNGGKLKTVALGAVKGSKTWGLSNPVAFKSAIQPGPDGTGMVGFSFTPKDGKGDWQIDDLYIDPLKSQ